MLEPLPMFAKATVLSHTIHHVCFMVASPLLKIGGAANVLGCFWAGLAGEHVDHVWRLTVRWLPDLVWPLVIACLYTVQCPFC